VICTGLVSCLLSATLFFVTHNTGQFLAVGTSSGAVGQYIKPSSISTAAWLQNAENGEGLRTTELYRVNEVSALRCSVGQNCVCVAVKGAVLLLAVIVFTAVLCSAAVISSFIIAAKYGG
jgi:hypothetical protein